MTKANQTADEQRHAEALFRGFFRGEDPGLEFDSPDPPAPDVLIRGSRLAEIAGLESEGGTASLSR